jgi:hypothetical protein
MRRDKLSSGRRTTSREDATGLASIATNHDLMIAKAYFNNDNA